MSLSVGAIVGISTLVAVAVGSAATATYYCVTEEDDAKNTIQKNEETIKLNQKIISDFNSLKTKLNNSKDYLNEGKKNFTEGGHVLDGVPLANSEFLDCLNKINTTITSIDAFISDLNSTITNLEKENKDLREEYDIS